MRLGDSNLFCRGGCLSNVRELHDRLRESRGFLRNVDGGSGQGRGFSLLRSIRAKTRNRADLSYTMDLNAACSAGPDTVVVTVTTVECVVGTDIVWAVIC